MTPDVVAEDDLPRVAGPIPPDPADEAVVEPPVDSAGEPFPDGYVSI